MMKRREFLGLVGSLPLVGLLGLNKTAEASLSAVDGWKRHGYIPESIGEYSMTSERGHFLYVSFYPPQDGLWIQWNYHVTPEWIDIWVNRMLKENAKDLVHEALGIPKRFTLTDIECHIDSFKKIYHVTYDKLGSIDRINGKSYIDCYENLELGAKKWFVTVTGQITPMLNTDTETADVNNYHRLSSDGSYDKVDLSYSRNSIEHIEHIYRWQHSPELKAIQQRRQNRIEYSISIPRFKGNKQ